MRLGWNCLLKNKTLTFKKLLNANDDARRVFAETAGPPERQRRSAPYLPACTLARTLAHAQPRTLAYSAVFKTVFTKAQLSGFYSYKAAAWKRGRSEGATSATKTVFGRTPTQARPTPTRQQNSCALLLCLLR